MINRRGQGQSAQNMLLCHVDNFKLRAVKTQVGSREDFALSLLPRKI